MATSLVDIEHGPYRISSDPSLVDRRLVHDFLSRRSYWAKGRPREMVDRSIDHSHLVMGAYRDGDQVGFARMVTDLATFAWLCDVFVLPEARGGGLGKALVGAIVEHPDVTGLKRQFLATADAHGLYSQFGYELLAETGRWMARPAPTG